MPPDSAFTYGLINPYTPAGRSIQAKGIVPDIESLQEVPEDVKAHSPEMRGESSLRGHLKSDGEEHGGSQSYVPLESKDDKALNLALDLQGVQANPGFPPNARAANLPH